MINPRFKSLMDQDSRGEQTFIATTEADIARQEVSDEAEAMQDVAKFVRRVRKRSPTGAAKALLKVLDKAPEAALAALH
ncbi:hypothetical protein [Castellaniella defragrans]|nr:hypothetical protein [Castellaniella defragrans]